MAASYGSLSCYDIHTGKQQWLQEYDQGFYSSPILNGDKIYLTDMNGITYLFKAEGKFTQVAENKLGEKVVATPAFMDKRIFLRGYRHLYAIGEK
jgi:outer membrane protein assembly factor BamB